ncbi:tRNA 2-thiouridine(34) synthase MnmA [Candidatus Nomurabacteria bacterium CG10_big_fil_rev_8_21_14_0_10_35_16]|uniref:tRNA-specific 2-thiouridylase MnmA n=1 Tax=Candidatus Nomurabacteria bacterium CG10_big_fil_rev_8_21_14_0_10_35_16 TaxID=1974731 RepID=A0A2H0TBM3_9BACT|nr:MAG: tRNA 2-thiouridine(34) synthase MnmA [Candidatus Nomurabacteria bacterium CG10_big_fil_rev_8_21_14_0_10_35_16]
MKKQKTVFLGMSGGVDSSVCAVLLKEQGYEVVGVFIRTWHPDFLECNEEEERRDAMRVAAHLDIPFLTFDFEKVYKQEVADYMIAEYKKGRTPNPDVMCNQEVKFGAFLKKALKMGADYVATGHYARVEMKDILLNGLAGVGDPENRGPEKEYLSRRLAKGIDSSKDQSYFLWTLKQKQLNKILFPIGHLKKTEVRKLAKKFRLPVAEKKDSQGICFLGAVDLKNFLRHYIKEKRGKVVGENGEVVGYHNGVVFHTLGERHGFTITKKSPNDGRYYVMGKDIKKNILTVSARQDLAKSNSNILTNYRIEHVNWISDIPKLDKKYTAQVRYHGEFLPCQVEVISKTKAEVTFTKNVLVASGQSCVIYDKDICLGGGVIV